MWVTQYGTGVVDRISTSGTATAVAHLGPDSAPAGITTGADGNLWIAAKSAIVRMSPQGAVTSFPLPDQVGGALRIVRGIGGDLWFVEEQGGHVGRITTAGAIRLLPQILDAPTGIVEGPDGHMWVAEQGDGRIDRLDGNRFTSFTVGSYSDGPEDIVVGPGRTLWFTEFVAGNVGWFSVPSPVGK
jgi:virginiamycin B lyase